MDLRVEPLIENGNLGWILARHSSQLFWPRVSALERPINRCLSAITSEQTLLADVA